LQREIAIVIYPLFDGYAKVAPEYFGIMGSGRQLQTGRPCHVDHEFNSQRLRDRPFINKSYLFILTLSMRHQSSH
jgi:hypothetical protein